MSCNQGWRFVLGSVCKIDQGKLMMAARTVNEKR